MNQNATKFYSSKQEHAIANYLDWKVVPGSGARDFHPGDIVSDVYLGECKTHTAVTNSIKFYTSVWTKIQNESESQMKCPVLFVDNGTQTIENTWCMMPKRNLNILPLECVFEPIIKYNKSGICIQHDYLKSVLHYSFIIVLADFPNVPYSLVLMSVPTLKGILDGELS